MKKLSQSESRELEVLRQLLVGPELDKLDQLSQRLDSKESFSSDIGEVLPQAMVKSAGQGAQLSQAMVPTVEEIVRLSIKRDINKFADALFPVVGPAIRKSIIETIREMMQSMNQVIEYSFSLKSIKWRWESMRTGIPFSQIVMLKSLVFEVQQVFLIHRKSGLLLNHLERENNHSQNPDLVSSMLTAITDFVSDSFDFDQSQDLDMIEFGEISIWIERSPTVILALAIRGTGPESLRTTMNQSLEQVESLYSDSLLSFNGDVTAFESTEGILYDCLQERYQSSNKNISAKFWLAVFFILGLLAYWAGTTYYRSMLQDDYLAILENEPGYAITRVTDSDGIMNITGLRDPLSRNPSELVSTSQIEAEEVVHRFQPYQSLAPSIIFKRVQNMLSPPANVTLEVEEGKLAISGFSSEIWAETINRPLILTTGIRSIENKLQHNVELNTLVIPETVDTDLNLDEGILRISGLATRAWREMAAIEAPKITGIISYDDSGLIDIIDTSIFEAPDSVELKVDASSLSASGEASVRWISSFNAKIAEYTQIVEIDTSNLRITEQINLDYNIQQLQDKKIFFSAATSYNFEAELALDEVAGLVKNIIADAKALEKPLKIIVQGFSDSVGSYDDNVFLSLERADYVSQYLFNTGISSMYVAIEGLKNEVEDEKSEQERQYNRRVEFGVEIK